MLDTRSATPAPLRCQVIHRRPDGTVSHLCGALAIGTVSRNGRHHFDVCALHAVTRADAGWSFVSLEARSVIDSFDPGSRQLIAVVTDEEIEAFGTDEVEAA